jgi:hypothetical protein
LYVSNNPNPPQAKELVYKKPKSHLLHDWDYTHEKKPYKYQIIEKKQTNN